MVSSGSVEFDKLKAHLDSNGAVRREVEFAFTSLLTAANPSDRGLRFLFGNGAEWIIAAAAWSAGVLTAPAGHNENGFDLGDLLHKNRSLWSVKASASKSSGQIRLINFMGDGSDRSWNEPTLFIGPYYEGAVLIDPNSDPEIKQKARYGTDALILPGGTPKMYAQENPQNHIRFDVAVNEGDETGDPYTFIKSILVPQHFPNLSKPFAAAEPPKQGNVVEAVQKLVTLKESGQLDEEAFQLLLTQLAGQ